jgi:glycolate oxidase iron-sulfur subunit
MAGYSQLPVIDAREQGPAQTDLDKCVHCGLCLNACPTYRELGVEMDSPRGRIYLMNQVANGGAINANYVQHMDLCLACRGCETACPSGVPYGRMIEAARAEIEQYRKRSLLNRLLRNIAFKHLLPSRTALQAAGGLLYLYQASGAQKVLRLLNVFKLFGKLGQLEALTPNAQVPFFYSKIGRTYKALGERKYRVAFMAGCIANISFARLNEATVRVLQRNGCEVVIPGAQTCCGALHLHSGLKAQAQDFARRNIDAVQSQDFDAVLTNAAGCGSTLK